MPSGECQINSIIILATFPVAGLDGVGGRLDGVGGRLWFVGNKTLKLAQALWREGFSGETGTEIDFTTEETVFSK